jgi:tRNA-splicing ligase RtcB
LPADEAVGRSDAVAYAAAAASGYVPRAMLVARIKRILDEQMGMSCELVADLSHNGIWQEQVCDREVYLHRHGACAFWPADRFSPDHAYANTGQPAFVGSSMCTPSALFVPGPQAHLTHYSISHGTGRCKGASLTETSDAETDMDQAGIEALWSGPGGVGGQLGHTYRPIEALADVMEQAGVARMVGKLVPVASYKAT